MVEAKGPGYADLLSKSFHQQEDIGASAKLLEQAGRQVQAAGRGRSSGFSQKKAPPIIVRNLFKDDVRLRQIEVIPYPPTGGN